MTTFVECADDGSRSETHPPDHRQPMSSTSCRSIGTCEKLLISVRAKKGVCVVEKSRGRPGRVRRCRSLGLALRAGAIARRRAVRRFYQSHGPHAGRPTFAPHHRCLNWIVERDFQFARFAVPRRVYSKVQMEYVAGVAERVNEDAGQRTWGYLVVEPTEVTGPLLRQIRVAHVIKS